MDAMDRDGRALIDRAQRIIRERFVEGRHHVGAAIRTKAGRIFAAVHLEATVGRIAVCAEACALGMAAAEGDTAIDCVVAVNRHGNIVSPCGMCRELISDYAPAARVIIPGTNGPATVPVARLLPEKYDKAGGPAGGTASQRRLSKR